MTHVTINEEQGLYVLSERYGYSCLGFAVAEEKTNAIINELVLRGRLTRGEAHLMYAREEDRGTPEGYALYAQALSQARNYATAHHTQLLCGLTPQLIGLEGKRVKVVDCYGEKRRFKVGKSTGWIPCHLELHNARSHGGGAVTGAVTGAPFKSVVVVK